LEYIEGSKEYHKLYMCKEIVFISDFPKIINLNNDNRLHSDKFASLGYRDGYSLYALNGIVMPKEMALIKPEELTKDIILNETNADIRRELIRKLPSERLIEVLDSTPIDEKHGYKLLSISMGDKRNRPYLWMKNPSLEIVHVEGVHPSCDTVEKAICYRNNLTTFEMPLALS